MCLVSPVKLKYILSEGCKLLRLVEGLEEWTQSSCYITSTEDGQPELKDLGVWQCDGARHTVYMETEKLLSRVTNDKSNLHQCNYQL